MTVNENQDFTGMVGALIISIISAAISITQRVLRGYPASAIWFFSESLSAILCGYLMWDIYPLIQSDVPAWASSHLMIAFAAHTGGKCFQWAETIFVKRVGITPPDEIMPKVKRLPKAKPEGKDHV